MKISILTSGNSRGSNFLAIYEYFKKNNIDINIEYVIVTEATAPIVSLAKERDIEIVYYSNKNIKLNLFLIETFRNNPVDLIVLAGFMRKLTPIFFESITTPLINIHPSLLPKFGGKGMYGMHVHQAVFEAGETKSGATVHYVNQNYDEGEIIMQKECDISFCASPDEVGREVLKIEHEIYPLAIMSINRSGDLRSPTFVGN